MLDCVTHDTILISDGRTYPEYTFKTHQDLDCSQKSTWLAADTADHSVYTWTTLTGNIIGAADSMATEVDAPGWYFLAVQDTNSNCITIDSVEVLEDILAPEFVIEGQDQQGCPDEVIKLTIMDLDTSRTYAITWSTPDGRIVGPKDKIEAEVDLYGTYYARVEDQDNGCEMQLNFEVENDWNLAEAKYQVSKSALEVIFADQSEGANLTWDWTFGDGESSQDQNPTHTYSAEGSYRVCLLVTNECGNSEVCKTVDVSENRGPLQVADVEILDVDCYGHNTGRIALNVSGGYPPYEVNWSNGETGLNIMDLIAGDYEATIIDNNANQIIKTYSVNEPEELYTSDIAITKDNGSGSGEILLTMEGGTGAFNFEWSDGGSDNPAVGLTNGDYHCTVTDENGCELEVGPIRVELSTSSRNYTLKLVSIYPNPASNNLCMDLDVNTVIEMTTVNVLGETVNMIWTEGQCANIEDLNPGIFWTTFKMNNGEVRIAKWVKSDR
jgi:PKD repeat protein